jgi:hypothetical protein
MKSHQTSQRITSHRQTVKAQKERELDLDLDGDGLTEREERKYGLNPLSPDSDGDGRYDGQEIGQGSNPRTDSQPPNSVEREDDKERLREAYMSHAQAVLNHPQLSYAALYQQIAGEEWLGRALNERVILTALQAGYSLRETKCLIAQSPYVQGQLSQGEWDKDSAIHYIDELTAPYQTNRKQEEELSE